MSHKIIPVAETPERKYSKGSIYDDVIDSFREGMDKVPLARIEMTKKKDGLQLEGTYLSNRLRLRIAQRELTDVKASTINKQPYLQKVG